MTDRSNPREGILIGSSLRRSSGKLTAAMLARAFQSDPAFSWLLPDPQIRAKLLPGLFRAMTFSARRRGLVLTLDDLSGATLWRIPGDTELRPHELLMNLPTLLRVSKHAGERAKIMPQTLAAHRPAFPFRYLQFAGVEPALHGKGLGGALVRAGLERAGQAGEPVYLETATEKNIGFYQSMGFKVTGEFDISGGGPHFWSMLWSADKLEI